MQKPPNQNKVKYSGNVISKPHPYSNKKTGFSWCKQEKERLLDCQYGCASRIWDDNFPQKLKKVKNLKIHIISKSGDTETVYKKRDLEIQERIEIVSTGYDR